MTQQPPPGGWYPDPAGSPQIERYWSGTAWTAQTRPSAPASPPATPQPSLQQATFGTAPGAVLPGNVGSSSPKQMRAQAKADRAYRKASRPLPLRHPVLSVLGAVVIIAVIASIAGSNAGSKTPPANTTALTGANAGTATTPTPTSPASTVPTYTAAQQNAIDAAKNYLQLGSGFSRIGLIQQLDSKAGDGFSKTLAVFAVGHVTVNWDAQAVEAAKNYLQLGTGFSRAGLIQQLSSRSGDQFTLAQAKYAARKVGL